MLPFDAVFKNDHTLTMKRYTHTQSRLHWSYWNDLYGSCVLGVDRVDLTITRYNFCPLCYDKQEDVHWRSQLGNDRWSVGSLLIQSLILNMTSRRIESVYGSIWRDRPMHDHA